MPARAPKSAATQHSLVFGAAIGAALAAAGALGWMLRAEIGPVPVTAPAVTPAAKPVSVVSHFPAAPASPAQPLDTVAPPRAVTSGVVAALPDQTATPRAIATDPQPRRLKRSKTAVAAPRPAPDRPKAVAKAALPPRPVRDRTSRWTHPATAVALRGRDFAPSFNCRRAIASVNRAICASPELSALDRQVSQTFYRATAKVDLERHKAIDRDQVDFLNQRARCTSDDCVAGVYRQRLDVLRKGAPGE